MPTGPDDCPDPETLAAYVDGLLDPATRAAVEAHAADCRDCREILTDAATFLLEDGDREAPAAQPVEETPPAPLPKVLDFTGRWRGSLIAALAVAAAAFIVVRIQPSWLPGAAPDMTALIAALDQQPRRPIDGRLSLPLAHRQQPAVTRGVAGRDIAPDLQIAASELEIAASGTSAAQQAARGIAALAMGDGDAGITALEEAARQSPSDPRVLNDLSVAYLTRASRTDRPDDWRLALQAADRALVATPAMREALFNRALALDGLRATDDARTAWQVYLKVDGDSEWAAEAKKRCKCRMSGS